MDSVSTIRTLPNIEPVPIRDKWPLLVALIEVVDGNITVPAAPELGVEFGESVIKRLQT
jgi:hypothetical protein